MRTADCRRIGVLVPNGNRVHEAEFSVLRPAGMEFRFSEFAYPPPDCASFCDDLAVRMTAPLYELREWSAELILIGCTTASMTCNAESYGSRLQDIAGVPVVTAAQAVRDALRSLNLRSIAVATPYGDINNNIVLKYLQTLGTQVPAIAGLGLDRSASTWAPGVAALTPRRLFELGMSVNSPAADALYLPCTGMPSLEAIEMLERATAKPVLSSVQVGYWASLRRLGLDGRQPGFGRLVRIWDFPHPTDVAAASAPRSAV